MGAVEFEAIGIGRDAREAFIKAVEDAQWEYGHGGYTGSIAEKPSYSLIALPPRISSQKFMDWIGAMVYSDHLDWEKKELRRLEAERAPRGQGEARRKRKADLRRIIKDAEKEARSVPEEHRELVRRACAIWDDKWGPALGWELPASEAREVKKRLGLAGTRKRIFLFCGMASS